MNTLRTYVAAAARTEVAAVARRWNMHQSKQAAGDDLTWLEGDKKMTPEERYVFARQNEMLSRQVAEINKKYEAEHDKTREKLDDHHSKSSQRIQELEKKITELTIALDTILQNK